MMNGPMDTDAVLVLIAPARRRDDIVDALMANTAISGFSVSHNAGFSREHSRFNLRERVQGYGDYERFEILSSAAAREALIADLTEMVGSDHLRYWVLPILDAGTIGRDTD